MIGHELPGNRADGTSMRKPARSISILPPLLLNVNDRVIAGTATSRVNAFGRSKRRMPTRQRIADQAIRRSGGVA